MVKWLKKDKTFVLRPYWQLARLTLERVVSLCQQCICILVVFVLPLWQLAGSTVEVGGPIIVSSVVNTSTRPQLLQWTLKDPHPPTQLPGSSQPAKFTQLTLYSTDNINLVFFLPNVISWVQSFFGLAGYLHWKMDKVIWLDIIYNFMQTIKEE